MLTVAGTLVGFLGGTYIPVASMSEWLQNVVKLLPVIHGTALMRRFCMQSASKTVLPGMLVDTVQTVFFEQMGVTLKNGAQTISILGQILLLIAWAVVVIVIAAAIAKQKKLKDR